MQISQAREQYVDRLVTRELSPHTIRAYCRDIVAFDRHLGGHADVGTIVAERIAEFIAAQRERGLSPMSMRRRAAGLRGFCRWLASRTLLDLLERDRTGAPVVVAASARRMRTVASPTGCGP